MCALGGDDRGAEPMSRRKTVDWQGIMSLSPCSQWPEERVRKAVPKRVSLSEFLGLKHIPPYDRLWVALHFTFLTKKLMGLFACACAERALYLQREFGPAPPRQPFFDALTQLRQSIDAGVNVAVLKLICSHPYFPIGILPKTMAEWVVYRATFSTAHCLEAYFCGIETAHAVASISLPLLKAGKVHKRPTKTSEKEHICKILIALVNGYTIEDIRETLIRGF